MAKITKSAGESKDTAKPKKVKKTTARKTTSKTKKFSAYEGKTLIIVESPAKAKTLEKILGARYKVLASVGHVKDLPKGRIAVDIENGFEPDYIQVRGKADLIKELKGASKAAKKTLLASDPDREGEAISWHLANLLDIDIDSDCRIRMHEITKNAAKEAVSTPDRIDMSKVNAQQARRVLDRLVGYQLSPLLWYKVQRGLSAGRVQSVALRIICEREDEIDSFIPEEYWLIDLSASSEDKERNYMLRLEKYNNAPVEVTSEKQAKEISDYLRNSEVVVSEYKTRNTNKAPLPPFKTSTMQQEASRRCGFEPKRTMRIAQSLYEGIELPGRGATGLITYMRTDSLRISPDAMTGLRSYITQAYGSEYVSGQANIYMPDAKAQDAHEAIRVTDVTITPDSIKEYLTSDQYKLYDLIWRRFVASQMADAQVARTTLVCDAGPYKLKQTGVYVAFEGWGCIYPLGIKDADICPSHEGEKLIPVDVKTEQKFTLPPSRYTEAGLVKVLEDKEIGRPSTYATIIDTLSMRGYTAKDDENKRLMPTKLGRLVSSFLVRYFSDFINVDFTAKMENELDQIEEGALVWNEVMSSFWNEFKPILDDVTNKAEEMHPEPEKIGEACPECGKDLIIKNGRFGEFIGCSGYPECKYTRKIVKTTGIKCPKCGQGELIRRKSTKGKTKGRFFYGCERYPECDFISWKKPKTEKDNNGVTTESEF